MFTILFCIVLITVGYHLLKKLTTPVDDIPSLPSLKFLWAIVTRKPQDELQEIISKATDKGILKADAGTIKFFYIQDVDYVKQFLTQSEDVLPKMDHNLGNRVKKLYGDGILFSNGDKWRMQRKLANAAFNKALSHDVIGENVFRLFKLMDCDLSKPMNIHDMLQRTAVEILGQVAFGHQFGGLDSLEVPKIIKTYKFLMEQTENQRHVLFPFLDKLPLKSNQEYREKMIEFDKFLFNIIERKRADLFRLNYQNDSEISKNKDLLMTMLEMSEKEGIKISSGELRDNLVNFLIAGHDTTSLNLSVSIFYLAKYPEMQKKAREEVIRVVGNDLIIPAPEQVKELKYINAVLKESLRKYPPLTILIPRQPKDYVRIGPYLIPPKSYNCVNVWHIHHDPNYWENPYQYDPERFLNGEKRHPFAWIPFSGGPRSCAGQNFSLMEQRILLTMMLLKYEWTLPEYKEKFELDTNFLLKPKDSNVQIKFEPRIV